jgi:beta-lactamase regulating signal transducer with metallopeptidase domain
VETLLHAGLSNAVSATILALFVACLARFLVRRPAVLHCLWLLVLVKLVTPPLYEVPVALPAEFLGAPEPAPAPIPLPSAPGEEDLVYMVAPVEEDAAPDLAVGALVVKSAPVSGEHPAAVRPSGAGAAWLSIDWMRLLVVIWLAGSVATLGVSAIRICRFRRVLREARPAAPELQEWAHDLALDLGLRRPPAIWWVDGRVSPLVWALDARARVIIPFPLWKSLDDRQRTTLLVHELAHLRRGDHHVRILELVVTALYWWHPVLWWVRQALRDVEEQCCDAWVVWAFPDAAKSYAEALLETLEFLDEPRCTEPLLASGFGKVHHLRRRLTMIMSGSTPRLLGLSGALGAVALAVVLLPVNASWGQQVNAEREVRVTTGPAGVEDFVQVIQLQPNQAQDVQLDIGVAQTSNPDQIRVVVDTNDDSTTVEADSIAQAIARLKDLIAKQERKESPSDQEKAQLKALQQVVKELSSMAKKAKTSGAAEQTQRVKIERRLHELSGEKLTEEKRAELNKARAKVKELSHAFGSMQKELAEAQRKLAQLEGRAIYSARSLVIAGKPPTTDAQKAITTYRMVVPKDGAIPAQTPLGYAFTARAASDDKRLSALEKKLDKLIEEVASLKKDREKRSQ